MTRHLVLGILVLCKSHSSEQTDTESVLIFMAVVEWLKW